MRFIYPLGATPLDEDEKHSLMPTHIHTQKELNAFESLNISKALPWAFKQSNLLNISFLKKLHKQMYGNTWKWAGEFRKTQKNIGVEVYRIESELFQLCGDVEFQINNNSFGGDEIAARLHHRLVYIHPFVNGNGRHARLVADLLLKQLGNPVFSWGSKTYNYQNIGELSDLRRTYINALRKADRGDYEELMKFVRS